MLSSHRFDYIHASPTCSTYSLLAGKKHRDKNNYNKTPQSHEADRLLMLLHSFIASQLKTNKRITVTIENPRGWMRKGNIMVRKSSRISDLHACFRT
jgi:site-specific DNA-cytosine methylase